MAYRSLIAVDFPVISTFESLVSEEVDGSILDASALLFSFNVLEAVSLVPSGGENVERDLATDGICEAVVWELLLQGIDQVSSDVMFLVVPIDRVSQSFLSPSIAVER